MTRGLLCYCRAGFEPDLAAELGDRAADAGIAGYARATTLLLDVISGSAEG